MSAASSRWTRRDRRVAVFVVAYVAVQLALPGIKLWEARPARFGWHMFSGIHPSPLFSVALPDGSTRPVAIEEHYGNPRADLHYEDHLPAHLCRRLPGIRAVHLERSGAPVEVHACR